MINMSFEFENKNTSFVESELENLAELVSKNKKGLLSSEESKALARKLSRYEAYAKTIELRSEKK